MEVFINGETGLVAPGGGEKIGVVLEAVRKRAAEKKRAVVSIRLDGEDISRKEQEDLADAPASRYSSLEVRTVDPFDLSRETLKGLVSHLENMERLHFEAAELVRAGEYKSALDKLHGCFGGWDVVVRAVLDISNLCGLELGSLTAGEKTLLEHVRGLKQALAQFRTSFGQADAVTVADIAEHKLVPAISDWKVVFESLSKALEEGTVEHKE